MFAEVRIEKRLTGSSGRYVATIVGVEDEAELAFKLPIPTLLTADHTVTPDSLRGTGVGAKLVAFMIDEARACGFKIIPICPYVKAQYKRHPEWRDVMTVEP